MGFFFFKDNKWNSVGKIFKLAGGNLEGCRWISAGWDLEVSRWNSVGEISNIAGGNLDGCWWISA